MELSPELNRLAEIFPTPLYVVGGAVRDFLLGNAVADIDLASELTPDEVFLLLKATPYKAVANSKKLGTLKISVGGEFYEYTTFREDSYNSYGSHSPTEVKFVKNLQSDCFRRDFSVNSVYFDIKSQEFIDYSGGIEDMRKKLIRTPRDPKEVLAEDALRIIRMVRFACQLGFQIEKACYECAKKMSASIEGLAVERIREEFEKIIVCDTVNGVSGAHRRAIEMLVDIGAMQYIIPELLEGIGFAQRADFHKYDVYTHILSTFEVAPSQIRLAALFHDIAKPRCKLATGKMAGHDALGAELTRKRMTALRYPKAQIERVSALVENHMYDLNCNTRENKLRNFVRRNYLILDDLIALKNADTLGGGLFSGENPAGIRLRQTREEMRAEGVAFCLKDLPINGETLIELGIPEAKRGEAMQTLLEESTNRADLRTQEGAKKFLLKYVSEE